MRKIILLFFLLVTVIKLVSAWPYTIDSILQPPNFAVNNQTLSSNGLGNNSVSAIYGEGISGKFNDAMDFFSSGGTPTRFLRNGSLTFTCSTTVNCSVLLWFRANDSNSNRYILEWRSGAGQYYFTGDSGVGSASYDLCNSDTSFTPQTGRWYALAVVLDIDDGKGRLWVDGKLNNTVNCNAANGNPSDLTIGRTNRTSAESENIHATFGPIWIISGKDINSTIARHFNYSGSGLTFSNYNMTSSGGCTIWNTDPLSPCNTDDTTPTVSFDTNMQAYCRIASNNTNYTVIGADRNCTSGEGNTTHICTLKEEDALLIAESYIYLACRDLSGDVEGLSGALRINLSIVTVETDGDKFLEIGINQSVIGGLTQIFSEKKVYIRTANNTQSIAKFDKVATYGNQIWAINYISNAETTSNFTYMLNVTPVFYVYEATNLTNTTLINRVKSFINSTKQ